MASTARKKTKSPLPPPRLGWAIYSSKGYIYAASNHYTKAMTIQRHCSDLGITWAEAEKGGDRLIRVNVIPVREA